MAKKKGDEKVNQTPHSDEEPNFDEEPDFEDPEGFEDDIPDEGRILGSIEVGPAICVTLAFPRFLDLPTTCLLRKQSLLDKMHQANTFIYPQTV